MDRLSELPDDILIHGIIALLPMAEAARTSILTRRWRFLWQYVTFTDLDFDASKKVASQHRQLFCKDGEVASDYIHWVGQFIDGYRNSSSTLRRFRIRFRMDKSFTREIDSWLQFCLGKQGTEALELDCCFYPRLTDEDNWNEEPCFYRFRLPSIILTNDLPKFKLLKSLTLSGVNISNDSLEHLLLECDFLETLQLRYLGSSLTQLNVPTSTTPLRLKSIEMFRTTVQWVSISAPTPDLVSLTHVHVPVLSARVEHAPNLVALSVDTIYNTEEMDLCLDGLLEHPLLCYFSQLQSLHLVTWYLDPSKVNQWLPHLPNLTNLNHLTLELHAVCVRHLDILDAVISFIKVARYLQRLTLWVVRLEERKIPTGSYVDKLDLPLLHELEIVGFKGREVECDLTVIFAMIAGSSLQRLIIDRRNPLLQGHVYGDCHGTESHREECKTRAMDSDFKSRLPSGVDFIVI